MNNKNYIAILSEQVQLNLFLSKEEKQYLLEQIPTLPKVVLVQIEKSLNQTDKKFKKSLVSMLKNDPQGNFWNAFLKFRKKQTQKLGADVSAHDKVVAEAFLQEQLNNL